MLAIRALSYSLLGLTPDELSRLAASGTRGWLATDHVTWVLSELNTMHKIRCCTCCVQTRSSTNEMARKRKIFNFGMLKRLVLPLNVGKENGQTFIGTMNKSLGSCGC